MEPESYTKEQYESEFGKGRRIPKGKHYKSGYYDEYDWLKKYYPEQLYMPKKSKPANKKNLKKTTAKGAYKTTAKKNFRARRRAFVETKDRTTPELYKRLVDANGATTPLPGASIDGIYDSLAENRTLSFASALSIISPWSMMSMQQGTDDGQMIGTSISGKYLSIKIELKMPEGLYQIKHPCDLYLIHGWVTQPIGANQNTIPTQTAHTRASVAQHVQHQIKQYFDDRDDKLKFIEKGRTNSLRILSYRKIKPTQNQNFGINPQVYSDTLVSSGHRMIGSVPTINMSCKWDLKNHKLHYAKGSQSQDPSKPPGTTFTGLDNFYLNHSWIPFACIYNPTFKQFESYNPANDPPIDPNYAPKIKFNDKFYYTDS